MQEHTLTLQEQEFKLVQTIRHIGKSRKVQDALIEGLLQEIETQFAQEPPRKPIRWLQVGDLRRFREFQPIKPKAWRTVSI